MTTRSFHGLDVDGDVLGAHANHDGMTVFERPRRGWLRWERRERTRKPAGDGRRLIATGAILLVLLGAGLLAVSIAAQYQYVLAQRHQPTASLIEATALDVGLIIFSLLALGLARKGLAAKTERALVVACAAGSALMNYAAANVDSPRSVLAFCMPPLFLAVVVDRVVATTRRHFLGMQEGRSPWSVMGATFAGAGRVVLVVALYGLRLVLAPPSTVKGARQAVLNATPVPAPPVVLQLESGDKDRDERQDSDRDKDRDKDERRRRRRGTKTPPFLQAAADKYGNGDLAAVPLDQVYAVSEELAPEFGLNLGGARKTLRAKILAARAAAREDQGAEDESGEGAAA